MLGHPFSFLFIFVLVRFNADAIKAQTLHLKRKETLKLGAGGYPKPDFTWTKDGNPLQPSPRIKILDDGSLEFSNVIAQDGGTYGYKISQFQGTDKADGEIVATIVGKLDEPN